MPIAAAVAAGGALGFAAIIAWLHARRPDVDPATQGVSHYAIGPTRAAATSAFLSLSIGLVGAALTLSAVTSPIRSSAIALIWLAALGIAVVAVVPTARPGDAAWRGPVHTVGALCFFIGAAVGAVAASSALGPLTSGVARLLAAMTALFLASMGAVPSLARVRGWLQRACFVLAVAWIMCMAYNSVIQS